MGFPIPLRHRLFMTPDGADPHFGADISSVGRRGVGEGTLAGLDDFAEFAVVQSVIGKQGGWSDRQC